MPSQITTLSSASFQALSQTTLLMLFPLRDHTPELKRRFSPSYLPSPASILTKSVI